MLQILFQYETLKNVFFLENYRRLPILDCALISRWALNRQIYGAKLVWASQKLKASLDVCTVVKG